MIAALFVETGGVYWDLPNVDPWDRERDARNYAGPWPVVAHPPCERWGRYWNGGPSAKIKRNKGDDNGCFASALAAVRQWGGILEHPEASAAWAAFGLNVPPRCGGWVVADWFGGWTCCVEQGRYGHFARKLTWLYACGVDLPSLDWGESEPRLPEYAVKRYGRRKASRIGMMATIASTDPRRAATPAAFRDLLISIAATARHREAAA